MVAGILAAGRMAGLDLVDQRVLLVGAGAAGVGIARHLRHALAAGGMSEPARARAVALMDTRGLVVTDRSGLDPHKRDVAWAPETASQFGVAGDAGSDLVSVIRAFRPTALVGTTGVPGVFDEEVVRAMADVDRPVVMALSNPTSKCEAVPADVLQWTDGRAIVATGSPFDPVSYHGRDVPISQCNNVYVFPGSAWDASWRGRRRSPTPCSMRRLRPSPAGSTTS